MTYESKRNAIPWKPLARASGVLALAIACTYGMLHVRRWRNEVFVDGGGLAFRVVEYVEYPDQFASGMKQNTVSVSKDGAVRRINLADAPRPTINRALASTSLIDLCARDCIFPLNMSVQCRLSCLASTSCHLTNSQLLQLTHMGSLRDLGLVDEDKITAVGLSQIVNRNSLRSISINQLKSVVADDVAIDLSAIAELRVVVLSGEFANDGFLAKLCSAGGMTSLSVFQSQVTDSGVLDAMAKNASLNELVSDVPMSLKTAEKLLLCVDVKNVFLTRLNASGTEARVLENRLKTAFPEARVIIHQNDDHKE